MIDPLEGPAEASSSRRRGSTIKSTGLDYTTSHRVDEDLLSRIRSLLVARNGHNCPPRTPFPSDDKPNHCLVACESNEKFDFPATKSVASSVRRERGFSLSESNSASSMIIPQSMDAHDLKALAESNPVDEFSKPNLRSSSSANDLKASDESAINISSLTDGPASLPAAKKSSSRFRLLPVLQDIPKKIDLDLVSCIEISPKVSEDDARIHEEYLTCCPPCDPPGSQPSKYIISSGQWPQTIEAGPSDLECFLAGCPPGQLNCARHPSPRRSHSTSLMDYRSRPQDFYVLGQEPPAFDVAQSISELKSARDADVVAQRHSKFSNTADDNTSKIYSEASPRTSATSNDVFPHATQSQQVVSKRVAGPPFSATIFTNFSLPGPKARRPTQEKARRKLTDPKQYTPLKPLEIKQLAPVKSVRKEPKPNKPPATVCTKQSNTSLKSLRSVKSKPKTPSIFSGASKSSANRHALLKSSDTNAEPVEAGLPIQPVLSTILSFAEKINLEDDYDNPIGPKDNAREIEMLALPERNNTFSPKFDEATYETSSSPVAGHLENLQKTVEFVDNVREQVEDAKQCVPRPETDSKLVEVKSTPPILEINPVDAAYWGFVPAVKGAVQDAVQLAVHNAVQGIAIPLGARKDEAAEAYRNLMAESLNQASKNADDYLKRPSLWNEQLLQKPKNAFQPKNTNSQTEPQQITPNDLETIPLGFAQVVNPGNQKQGQTFSQGVKGMTAGHSNIPDRHSSKHRAFGTKAGATNSSQKPPLKETAQRKRSFERLIPKGSHDLRSVSSADSLKNPKGRPKKKPSKDVFDPIDDQGSASNSPPGRQLSRKNTAHWLRELLSSNGPYETRLTALPPRTKRASNSSRERGRSQSSPLQPVKNLYLGATPKPGDHEADEDVLEKTEKQIVIPEAFTRTIDDLEVLLNEALIIAQQAADREDHSYMPKLLGNAARILKDGRKGLSEGGVLYQLRMNDIRSKRSATCSDKISSIASIHESMMSYTGTTGSEFSEDDRYDRHHTYENDHIQTKDIIIPPKDPRRKTGRVLTPCQRRSLEQSRDSMEAEVPLMSEVRVNNDDFQLVKRADSRSLPPEIDFADFARPSKVQPGLADDSSPPEALGELIALGQPPDFGNPDPFIAPISTGTGRKLSNKSPRRGSPPRNGHNIPTIITDDQGVIPLLRGDSLSKGCHSRGHSQDGHQSVATNLAAKLVAVNREVREYTQNFRHPSIYPRDSSLNLRKESEKEQDEATAPKLRNGKTFSWQDIDHNYVKPCSQAASIQSKKSTVKFSAPCTSSMDGSEDISEQLDSEVSFVNRGQPRNSGDSHGLGPGRSTEDRNLSARQPNRDQGYDRGDEPREGNENRELKLIELRDDPNLNLSSTQPRRSQHGDKAAYDLKCKNHFSLRRYQHKGFSFSKSHKRQGIARDWKPARKRFVATVACISTALVGILIGIYAGEVPAIQYYIVDFHHYAILGNVFFFLGLAIPTFFFWPLPLLHGRKPYILGSMALAMPLLFPQAIAVGSFRSPYVRYWRVGLILPRAFMGFCLGFANMNFKSTLTDLFGASLQSDNPHQEVVDENDVRRHGGGMGIWLGIWTWSAMGSIGLGFMIGAVIINYLPPAWGFYVSIAIIAAVLFLNIITPEVRRAAFRRSVAEVRNGEEVSYRLAKGEVKMHMVQTGPKWWGEEFHYGYMLSIKMLYQPGFMVIALYVAWMYAQIVLIIMLLGSLTSKHYKLTSPLVGASVTAVPIGAMMAIPFQKASFFSRAHNTGPTSDNDTYKQKMSWSSHMVRRSIFILVLPFAGLGYTLSSTGPPIPLVLPIGFATLIGFLSNLAMAECHGILMEAFDTSDLQSGMAGRAKGSSGDKKKGKRTNYSSFPRVASAFAITQAIGYVFAAIATGVGGSAERNLGQQSATGIMAGILLILSLLLLGVLVRFKDIQIIPDSKNDEMTQWKNTRKVSAFRRAPGAGEDEPWRPIIIGNPTHHTRRMCILEMGALTRWSEIRRKNMLVDSNSLEAKHPNLAVIEDLEVKLKKKEESILYGKRKHSQGANRGSNPEAEAQSSYVDGPAPRRSGRDDGQMRYDDDPSSYRGCRDDDDQLRYAEDSAPRGSHRENGGQIRYTEDTGPRGSRLKDKDRLESTDKGDVGAQSGSLNSDALRYGNAQDLGGYHVIQPSPMGNGSRRRQTGRRG